MKGKSKKPQILYGVAREPNHLAQCYDYLCSIGLHWFNASEIIGRYPVDEIRKAVLIMKHNNVNVAQRHRTLLELLKGKEHEIWRKHLPQSAD